MAGRKKTVATKIDERGKEIIKALQSFEESKGLGVEVVCNALEEALVNAYQKSVSDEMFGSDERALARASVNPVTGEIKLFNQKRVVEEVEDDFFEISLEDAHETNPELNVGDLYEIPVSIDNFMRATAMHVKTVLKQKVREAEKEAIYNEYIDKKDEIISGIIEKVQEKFVLVNLGRVIAIMPSNQWVATENYRIGDSINVYVVDVVKDSKKSSPVLVSRNHPNFLRRIMEREINEIYDGTVEIRSIAREAGDRSKVAVWSTKENVDATGACIGAKGVRIQSISQQLAGEKIDVILYDERPEFYVAEALKPSKVFGISLDSENKSMVAIVPNEDFSLAIGKKGQNARLAVKLTGWKIDIKTVDEALSQNIPFKTMNEIEREYNNVDVAVVEENPYDEVIAREEVVEQVEEAVTEEVVEEVEVKEEVVAEETPKAKTKTSIYESTIAYKGSSSLEDRTSIEEKAIEIASQVKQEEPKKEEVKKQVKVEKKETPKPEEKNYMPIYSQEELDALDAEEEEYEEDIYDYDEYDDDSYYE